MSSKCIFDISIKKPPRVFRMRRSGGRNLLGEGMRKARHAFPSEWPHLRRPVDRSVDPHRCH